MLEVLGLESNSIYPVIALEKINNKCNIITKSPSNLGKSVKRTDKANLHSYSKLARRFNDSTFKIPIADIKSLISTFYINHFRPNYVYSTVCTKLQPRTLSGFQIKFDTVGHYYI
jgi:hypothetical protein